VSINEAQRLLALSTTDADALGAVLRISWALLLRSYTGQDDVSFGFQHHNGDAVARFLLDDSASVAEALERAKADLAGDLPPVPTWMIRSGDSGLPLFDTAVVLWNLTKTPGPCHVLGPVRNSDPDPLICTGYHVAARCDDFPNPNLLSLLRTD
jgi:hypothetical protein